MSQPLPLFTFSDTDGRFQDDAEYVDADGACVVVGRGGSGELWSWRPDPGTFTGHPIPGPATVSHAATWHDGRLLALVGSENPRWDQPHESGDAPVARLWNLRADEQVGAAMPIEYGWGICSVTLWSNGDRLVGLTGTDNCFALTWDVITGERIGGKSEEIGESVDAVAIAEVDGKPLAVVGSLDETVRIWEVDTERDLGLWSLPSFVEFVGVTELDDRPVLVAAGGFEDVRVWDIRAGAETEHRLPYGDSEHELRSMLRDGDRTLLLFASFADDEHPVRLFDLASGAELAADLTASAATGLLARHHGLPILITVDGAGTGRIWDLTRVR